jgi:hypothetical protein
MAASFMRIAKMTTANVTGLVAKGWSGVDARQSDPRIRLGEYAPRPRDGVAGSVYSGPQKFRDLWKPPSEIALTNDLAQNAFLAAREIFQSSAMSQLIIGLPGRSLVRSLVP